MKFRDEPKRKVSVMASVIEILIEDICNTDTKELFAETPSYLMRMMADRCEAIENNNESRARYLAKKCQDIYGFCASIVMQVMLTRIIDVITDCKQNPSESLLKVLAELGETFEEDGDK